MDEDAHEDSEADCLRRAMKMSLEELSECEKEKNSAGKENLGLAYDEALKLAIQESLNEEGQMDVVDQSNYQLHCVISHSGFSATTGHYVTYARDALKNTWRKYNDAFTKEVGRIYPPLRPFLITLAAGFPIRST